MPVAFLSKQNILKEYNINLTDLNQILKSDHIEFEQPNGKKGWKYYSTNYIESLGYTRKEDTHEEADEDSEKTVNKKKTKNDEKTTKSITNKKENDVSEEDNNDGMNEEEEDEDAIKKESCKKKKSIKHDVSEEDNNSDEEDKDAIKKKSSQKKNLKINHVAVEEDYDNKKKNGKKTSVNKKNSRHDNVAGGEEEEGYEQSVAKIKKKRVNQKNDHEDESNFEYVSEDVAEQEMSLMLNLHRNAEKMKHSKTCILYTTSTYLHQVLCQFKPKGIQYLIIGATDMLLHILEQEHISNNGDDGGIIIPLLKKDLLILKSNEAFQWTLEHHFNSKWEIFGEEGDEEMI